MRSCTSLRLELSIDMVVANIYVASVERDTKLLENELVWLTDETAHESLLLHETQYRQFFRFVGPYVSHWYADHSTANPLCPVPDDVVIVRGNKFGIGYREEEDCTVPVRNRDLR